MIRARAIALVLVACLVESPVAACSCAPRPEPESALAKADLVFRGEVVGVDSRFLREAQLILWYSFARVAVFFGADDDLLDEPSWSGLRVRFRVDEPLKGGDAQTVVILTGLGGGDCGYPFDVGREYLVYAYGEDPYHTGICSRTQRADGAVEELETLRRATE